MAEHTTSNGFLDGFAGHAERIAGTGPDWLTRRRRAALAHFEVRGLPTAREEAWRATNIAPISAGRFAPATEAAARSASLPADLGLCDDALRLVFVDGRYQAGLSDVQGAQSGLWIGSLVRALDECPERVRPLIEDRPVNELEPFAALNAALCEDGAVLLVDDGVAVERPIEVVFASTATPGAAGVPASFPSIRIALGRGSRARVSEIHCGPDDGSYLRVAHSTVHVGDGASFERTRLNVDGRLALVVTDSRSIQGRDSRVEAIGVDLGGRLVRHDATAVLDGEGAHSRLDGLYLTVGEQHVDNHTVLDHAKPRGDSRELFKGILGGASSAVFNGRIIVRQDAQKTDSKQSNPNLVLSDKALAHTRPQLEIYADDVKCTHGATVGRLDQDAVFYLRSRGIPETDATNLLISSFAGEVLQRIPQEELRTVCENRVAERLGRLD